MFFIGCVPRDRRFRGWIAGGSKLPRVGDADRTGELVALSCATTNASSCCPSRTVRLRYS